MKEFDDLSGLAVFVHTIEAGSLSAAARALDKPKATISRHLAALEKRLGTALVQRSTRALSLTDAGRRYFEQVHPLVYAAQDASRHLQEQNAIPSGTLRISAPVAYGQMEVTPRLVSLMHRHPALRFEMRLDDNRVSVIAEGFDLAIRMGHIENSELICRKLVDVPMVIVAAPAWVARHGAPETPSALAAHVALVTRPDLNQWTVGGETIRMGWRMSTSNMMVTRDAVCAGLGVALVPHFVVRQALALSELVQLLPGFDIPAAQATALYPKTIARSAAMRAVIDALTREADPAAQASKDAAAVAAT